MAKSCELTSNNKVLLASRATLCQLSSPKMPTKIFPDFCPTLSVRAKIWKNFGWHYGRNDDLINAF